MNYAHAFTLVIVIAVVGDRWASALVFWRKRYF